MTDLAVRENPGYMLSPAEYALLEGDLSKLSEEERTTLYNTVCQSLGLNPMTGPFGYIRLNGQGGKLTLYAKKDCTEQLRKIHGVAITELTGVRSDGVYLVTAKAQDATGRYDVSTGAVPIEGLRGDALCNALMKAETKAKRRVTLSICGLGVLDESEASSIPNVRMGPPETHVTQSAPVPGVDTSTGEIVDEEAMKAAAEAEAAERAAAKAKKDAEAKQALIEFTERANEEGYKGDIQVLARKVCHPEKPLPSQLRKAINAKSPVWIAAIDELNGEPTPSTLDMPPTAEEVAATTSAQTIGAQGL